MDVENETVRLRVLIANQRPDRLTILAEVIEGLGHEVVAQEIDVGEVGAVTGRLRPDVALVAVGAAPRHSLELISAIVREAFCPVIALIPDYDAEWIKGAASRGIYGYIQDARPEEIQSAIDIALVRFVEYHRMKGAFQRGDLAIKRQEELLHTRQRLLLELHDGLLQQLTTASLGLQRGKLAEPLASIAKAIEQGKASVTTTINELIASGSTLAEVMGDSSASDERWVSISRQWASIAPDT